MKEKQVGITAKKENFSEWYPQVIQKADLADYTEVSGCIVFKPNSYAVWERIVAEVDRRIKKLGVKNAYFPLFIPEKFLKKEQAHVKGFSPEVAWVTHAGGSKLDEKLAVRPTSETIMYDSYSKWIRSWKDLPLRLNQWNSVVRWEFKHPVPFLRTREFLWNEGHTAFATKKEAEKEIQDIINMYNDVLENFLALPGLIGKKTEHEKFAGAEYTISIELLMPNGRAIQGPDAHFDGQNFAKAFDISFLDQNEKKQYAWQNTWAITTRMLGIMIAIHGDDKGAVLPPRIAPVQIGIVPILFKDSKDKVLKKAREIEKSLRKYAVILDERDDYSAGWKFNEMEMKGVPIRVEIGPKDVEKDQVVVVRRDTGEKEFVKVKDLTKKVAETLDAIHNNLFNNAEKFLKSNIVKAEKFDELKKAINNKKLVLAPFCGEPSCEDWIKDKTGGATTRNIPFDQKPAAGKCVHCGKEAKFLVYFGKSY
ncbi:proline--tRNA ligase [Candidatus Woesearchaeota archaeon]|nr:proline--tRNA ligase [Candidatus Woesearchaeota archaeon]